MWIKTNTCSNADTFSKQLLKIGKGKVAVDEITRCITLLTDFCTIVNSQKALIELIFYTHTGSAQKNKPVSSLFHIFLVHNLKLMF
jgi:hypothetical protein